MSPMEESPASQTLMPKININLKNEKIRMLGGPFPEKGQSQVIVTSVGTVPLQELGEYWMWYRDPYYFPE